MSETYEEVEKRIGQAIVAINTRKKVCRSKIAREFNVSIQRLRSRLNRHPAASTVRGLYRRILAPDQDKALHDYFVQLDKIGMPARLHLIEQAANLVLQMSIGLGTPPPQVGP